MSEKPMKVKRPALRYHGGKWILAEWIISHFPKHRIYAEPFGGAASVLIQKPRSYAEIYNDLCGEVVNFFRVLRDNGEDLTRRLSLTPFARVEFKQAYNPSTTDPVEAARQMVVRSFMGFGSTAASGRKTGFRSNSNRYGTTPAHDWANYPDCMSALVERMRGVVIEQRPAADLIAQQDSPKTLFYVDPPYVHQTRKSDNAYRFEMTDADHRTLAGVLKGVKGMVILSGYSGGLYTDLYGGWETREKKTFADGASERTEVLWMNQNCVNALAKETAQTQMFK